MTTALTSADIVFDPIVHAYTTPDGRQLPSVTTILKAVGVSADFEGLSAMSSRLGAQIDYRRELGSAVHADIHSFDDDDLDFSTLDPRVRPYVDAWATFRTNLQLTPTARERLVFHPLHWYAGTLDGIFLMPSGDSVLIDVKIGDPRDAAAHLQTAAYEGAYLAEHADARIHQRWSVQLCPEAIVPYRITRYPGRPDGWRDFQKFLACVAVFHEQPERRRTA